MQCTCTPATIGDQGRELQSIPKANSATVSTQPETMEAESPAMAWKMVNLVKDQGELLKNYIPIDGPRARDKFTHWLSTLSPGWQSGFLLTDAVSAM